MKIPPSLRYENQFCKYQPVYIWQRSCLLLLLLFGIRTTARVFASTQLGINQ